MLLSISHLDILNKILPPQLDEELCTTAKQLTKSRNPTGVQP
jgi:hypothetical protein